MRAEFEYASRFVIVNADDFGRSEKINHAVIRAHTHGILTSASLMMGEPACRHAIALAFQHNTLGVGLHLTLSEGVPVLPRSRIAPIMTPGGRLSADLFTAGLRYTFKKATRRAILDEMKAQFDKFEESTLGKSHVDGHQHFHLHPVLWDEMIRLSLAYGFEAVRVPREEFGAHFRTHAKVTLDTIAAVFFRVLTKRNMKAIRQHNLFVSDRVYGMLQTAQMDADYTLQLLGRLRGHTNEIYCHPGSDYAARLPESAHMDGVDDVEYAMLLDLRLRDAMERLNLARGNYFEIRQAAALDSERTRAVHSAQRKA